MKLLALLLSCAAFGAEIKVAAVQFRSSGSLDDNRQRIVAAIEKLAAEKVDVAVFPECALTSYNEKAINEHPAAAIAAAEDAIRAACGRVKISAVVGSVHKVNGKTYNTAIVINEHGELVERYGKVMLAGETWATSGNHIAYFELKGIPSTVIICHDERYPELARLPAIQGARLLYYISHESGMDHESKLAPYRAQLMARAVENNLFIVAANAPGNRKDGSGSHGQSRIVLNDGNIAKEASIFGEETLIETLHVQPGRLERPLRELNGGWWHEGVERMMQNRNRKLE